MSLDRVCGDESLSLQFGKEYYISDFQIHFISVHTKNTIQSWKLPLNISGWVSCHLREEKKGVGKLTGDSSTDSKLLGIQLFPQPLFDLHIHF